MRRVYAYRYGWHMGVVVWITPRVGIHLGTETSWVRIGRRLLMLKTPLNEPIFSERYGYRKPIARAGGWRLFWESSEPIHG